MKKYVVFFFVFLLSVNLGLSQDHTIDSLLSTRKVDSLPGKIKMYYSPNTKAIAKELQDLVTDAIKYYEAKYRRTFKIKMIVLDSAQWFSELIPYGFVFYDGTDWLVLNSGMTYQNFKSTYGFDDISLLLDSSFAKNKVSPSEVVYARLKFLSLHELGHYFIYNLSNAKSPDHWTDEFIAWYFANEYISAKQPTIKKGFEIFCRTIANCYPPQQTTLSAFNELYSKIKIGNFAWYHSRFYFLADSLYNVYGTSYLRIYEKMFPKKNNVAYPFNQILNSLDADKTGITKRWVLATESNNKVK